MMGVNDKIRTRISVEIQDARHEAFKSTQNVVTWMTRSEVLAALHREVLQLNILIVKRFGK